VGAVSEIVTEVEATHTMTVEHRWAIPLHDDP